MTGDNQIPSALDDLNNRLADSTAPLLARIKELRVALERIPEVITEDLEAPVTDQIGQAKLALKRLEDLRTTHKKPIDEMAGAVQSHFKDIVALISESKGAKGGVLERALQRLGTYQKVKADRERTEREAIQRRAETEAAKQRETAAAAEQEASERAKTATTTADREAAAEAAVRAQQATKAADAADENATLAARRSPVGHAVGTGAKSHLRTVTKFRVDKLADVPRAYLMIDEEKIRLAMDAGMTGTAIPGITIFDEEVPTLVVRS